MLSKPTKTNHMKKPKSYVVKWEIDIEANSPEEAAKKALAIQRNSESIAVVFDVHSQKTKRKLKTIDLIED